MRALILSLLLLSGAANAVDVICPGAPPVNGAAITPTSVTTSLVKADVVDAGVMYVAGSFQAMNGTLKALPAGVDISTDFTVSGSNDAVFNRQVRINGDILGSGGAKSKTNTAPTVTACSGGTAASVTWSNDSSAFVFDVGTSCAGESTAVVTFEATSTGYICSCSSTTADRIIQQKVMPASTTQVTLQNIVVSTGANGDFTDGADVACQCTGG